MAPPVDPRLRSRSWRGEDVQLAEVLAHLNRLQVELAHHDAGQDDHPHPRNCVMNLVVVTPDRTRADAADPFAATVASQHPLRAIVIHDNQGEQSRIDAEIHSHATQLLGGAPIQREQIVLHVGAEAARHLPSLLEPLLVPDVPTYLWWMGTPPLGEKALREAFEAVDVLIVDSAAFERPFAAFRDLAELAASEGRVDLADLQWERLRAWREAIAQFFSGTETKGFLAGLSGVGVDYGGEGRANRIAAALVAGWLQARLGWRLRRSAAGRGGTVLAYLEGSRQRPVEVAFRSVPAGGVPGDVEAIRLEGAFRGRTFAVAMQRDPQQRHLVDVLVQVGGQESVRQLISMPSTDEGQLLLRLIAQGRRDDVYLDALSAGSRLLASGR